MNKREGKVGFVSGVETKDGQTLLTIILNYQELRDKPLLLGEFLFLKSGQYYREDVRNYLVLVTDAFYRPVAYQDHARALALGHLNEDGLDENAIRQMNFLHYQVAILGVVDHSEKAAKFYPNTRTVPSLIDVAVEFVADTELQELINVSIAPEQSTKADVPLGYLQYGSAPEQARRDVHKYIDVKNFLGRRTANFGKTGLGKSNENKVILCLVKQRFPKTSALILDLNGEYAQQTTGTTSSGLISAFTELGIQGQIVWYTNRSVEDLPKTIVKVKPPRIDFYEFPELALELAIQRSMMMDPKVPAYLEGVYNSISEFKPMPNKMAYIYGAFAKAGLACAGRDVRLGNKTYRLPEDKDQMLSDMEASSQKTNTKVKPSDDDSEIQESPGSTKELFRWANRLSFLKSYHGTGLSTDLFSAVLSDLAVGRYVIVDLPSLNPEAVQFISERLAAKLFVRAQDAYADGKLLDTLVVIEEAHNLLRDNRGVFYRLAKEGRKYGLGMLYSTQSPSGVDAEIIAQTENFFVKHVSSEGDVNHLAKSKAVFGPPVSSFLLHEPVLGLSYVYMEPYQAFPIPVKVQLLEEVIASLKSG